jgi:hypothetical protein
MFDLDYPLRLAIPAESLETGHGDYAGRFKLE